MLGGFSVLSDVPQAALGNIRPAAVPSHGSDDNPTLGTLSCVFWKEWRCLKNLETTRVLVTLWSISAVLYLHNVSIGSIQEKKKKRLKKCLKSSASGFTPDSSLLTPWHKCHFLQGLVKDSVRDLWDFAYYFVGPWPLVTPANHTESVCVQRYRISLHLLFIRISQRSTISSKPEVWFQAES